MSEWTTAGMQNLRGEMREREPMARHTTWRAGGSVERAYFPADRNDLRAFVASLPPREPVYWIGLGSNLLVRDGGLRGTVIFTHRALNHIGVAAQDFAQEARAKGLAPDASGLTIVAEAGVPSPRLARFAARHDLAGAEFMAGIPGTVGGALAMNAGCFGGETWNIVASVTTLDRRGDERERTRADYEIGYRTVVLKHAAEFTPSEEWFIAARFALSRGVSAQSLATIKRLLESRIAAQPLDQPNAGSVFRNPPGDYAARLIEACGLKGYARGGAMISSKHSNFIVNTGGACAADIEALIELAVERVRERFGIELEREVRIIGEERGEKGKA